MGKIAVSLLVAVVCLNLAGTDGFIFGLFGNGNGHGIGAHIGAGNGGGIGAGVDLGPLGHVGVNLGGRHGLGIGGHVLGVGGHVGLGGGRCGPVCQMYCPNGNVKDAYGCPICKCKPRRCPPLCRMYCPTGNVKDANGCPICKCNPRPINVEVNTHETSTGFSVGSKFDISYFKGKCPVGTKEVGNMCQITSTRLFLPWLKANAKAYGITYSYTPVKVTESDGGDEGGDDDDEEK